MAHGGDHGGDGPAQPPDLVAAALLKAHLLAARLQLPHRLVQPEDGVGDVGGDAEVEKGHQKGGEQEDSDGEEQQIVPLPQKGRVGDHAHQSPPGVPHCFHRHIPPLPLEHLLMGPVAVGRRRQVVLLQQPRVDQLLPGVVDQLPIAVNEVDISPVGQIHVLAHLRDAAKAHVHQQHPPLRAPISGELHMPAEGHHPPGPVVRVVKELLDVGGGEVEVLHFLQRHAKPGTLIGEGGEAAPGEGHRRLQRAPLVKDGNGDQGVPVLLIEQPHVLRQGPVGDVGFLDHPVVHRVRHPHHPPQVAVQIHIDLGQQPLGALLGEPLRGVGEAQEDTGPHKDDSRQRHSGKGQRQHHLDTHPPIPLGKPPRCPPKNPPHPHPSSPLITQTAP